MQSQQFASAADAPAHTASRSRALCKFKLQRRHMVAEIRRQSMGWPALPTMRHASSWVSPSAHAALRVPEVPSQGSPLPESSSSWAEGDVLRLELADGRRVYAEVVSGVKTPHRTGGTTQSPPTASDNGGQRALDPPTQLLCQGIRYSARELSTAREPEHEHGSSRTTVLEAVGAGAAPSGDPNLRALLDAPPKRHAAALRAWAPLTGRLLQPAARPAATATATAATAAAAAPGQQAQQAPVEEGNTRSLEGAAVVGAERISSLEQLRRQAATDPGPWVHGSGPSDPPASEDARAVATAGELACFLEGHRGVVLLQLHVGWDAHENVPPYGPYKPLVVRLLRDALERPDIVSYTSSAPVPGAASGNPSYGMTLVLCADKEPFRSWGAHLASFGCQAALEAQSPYYKLLIGRILGYRPEYIAHHIQEKHGAVPSREVVAAVEQQLLKLSSKSPKLPWNVSSRGGGRRRAK